MSKNRRGKRVLNMMKFIELHEMMVKDKELLKLKKAELIEMIIKRQYTNEELESIKQNDFATFQLREMKDELMLMNKPLLIYHYLQEN